MVQVTADPAEKIARRCCELLGYQSLPISLPWRKMKEKEVTEEVKTEEGERR